MVCLRAIPFAEEPFTSHMMRGSRQSANRMNLSDVNIKNYNVDLSQVDEKYVSNFRSASSGRKSGLFIWKTVGLLLSRNGVIVLVL